MIRFMLMTALMAAAIFIAWTDDDGRSWIVFALLAAALLVATTYALPALAADDPEPDSLSRLDRLDRSCCLVEHAESDPGVDDQLNRR